MSSGRKHREMDERMVRALIRRAAGDTRAPGALSMSWDELGAYVRCQQRGGFEHFSPLDGGFRRPTAEELVPPEPRLSDGLAGVVGRPGPCGRDR